MIAPQMNLSENSFDLTECMSVLSLKARQTDLLMAPPMKWSPIQYQMGFEFKHIYLSRLAKMNDRFREQRIMPISQVMEDRDIYCLKGIVKRLEFKRVRAFENGFDKKYQTEDHLYNQHDQLEIEDSTGKIKFYVTKETVINLPNWKPNQDTQFPSGVMVVISGKFRKKMNKFIAKQIQLPQLPPQSIFTKNYIHKEVPFHDKKMLVISQPTHQLCMRVKSIVSNSCEESSNITALVIIGGIKMTPEDIRWMNGFVSEIRDYIDVFLMPSSSHQHQQIYPLRPYTQFFFLKVQSEIGLCSNPQLFQGHNGFKVHVSCGENVKDFIKNSSLSTNQIDVMQYMLNFGHYCPTSPFSLKTEPFYEDHLVIDEPPHVMVSGKAKSFGSRVVKIRSGEILLVAIPQNRMALVGLNGGFINELL